MELVEGAWYRGSDGSKWKVKLSVHGFVMARKSRHLLSTPFYLSEVWGMYIGRFHGRYVMLYHLCKIAD